MPTTQTFLVLRPLKSFENGASIYFCRFFLLFDLSRGTSLLGDDSSIIHMSVGFVQSYCEFSGPRMEGMSHFQSFDVSKYYVPW